MNKILLYADPDPLIVSIPGDKFKIVTRYTTNKPDLLMMKWLRRHYNDPGYYLLVTQIGHKHITLEYTNHDNTMYNSEFKEILETNTRNLINMINYFQEHRAELIESIPGYTDLI